MMYKLQLWSIDGVLNDEPEVETLPKKGSVIEADGLTWVVCGGVSPDEDYNDGVHYLADVEEYQE